MKQTFIRSGLAKVNLANACYGALRTLAICFGRGAEETQCDVKSLSNLQL